MRAISAALIMWALGCFVLNSHAKASNETVLYSFCSQKNCTDGQNPYNSVINVNGMLYGITGTGGSGGCNTGCGTLFSLDPGTDAETVLHSFGDYSGDGIFPSGNLIDSNGILYGTTSEGGAYGYVDAYRGTVFSFNLTNDAETVVYSFCRRQHNGCKDGNYPNGGVIVHHYLYGTTFLGGKSKGGLGRAAFSINLDTGFEKVRYTFPYESSTGYAPVGGLIYVGGTFYGVTEYGGNVGSGSCYGTGFDGCGTIFSLDVESGAETVLHSFLYGDSDGAFPAAGMIEIDGKLYGTTYVGGKGNCFTQEGATGCGTVFSLDLKTDAEKILYFFCSEQSCADGDEPTASLINVNGTLYGTTSGGGAYSRGTVFSIDRKTGAETVVYSFCSQQDCVDGLEPVASLISVKGILYGTTVFGGAYGAGTVFSIKP